MNVVVVGRARGSIPACAGEPATDAGCRGRHRVYPRVCGGTQRVVTYAPCLSGLSPRVRGNPLWGAMGRRWQRSIPACAGEPGQDRDLKHICEVYPRVCGGTSVVWRVGFWCRGLSPRVRGNQFPSVIEANTHRSIPACAGEPRRCWDRRSTIPVYPRVCGGTVIELARKLAEEGLSPRVRGNRSEAY